MGRERQPLKMVDTLDNTVKYFDSIGECAEYFGINIGSISSVINRAENNIYKYRYKIIKISPDYQEGLDDE